MSSYFNTSQKDLHATSLGPGDGSGILPTYKLTKFLYKSNKKNRDGSDVIIFISITPYERGKPIKRRKFQDT